MNKFFQTLLLLMMSLSFHAQIQDIDFSTPKEYFDEAAKQYISDDKLSAVQTLQAGLEKFGDDEEMRALAEELFKDMQKEQKQQQEQQEKEQEKQEDNEQKKEEEKQEQEKGDQGEEQEKEQGDKGEEQDEGDQGDEQKDGDGDQDGEEKDGEDGKEKDGENGEEKDGENGEEKDGKNGEEKDGKQGEEENKDGAAASQGKEGEDGDQNGQRMVPVGISKADAERILKAVNNSEKKVQAKVIKKKSKSTGKGKTEKDW